MADIGWALQAKSDQINFDDVADTEIVITISEVRVRNTPEQPVWVYFHGCNNRPWKPAKGVLRLLSAAWGRESDLWVGKSVKLYGDSSVKWAGKEVGGIRVRALSDIPKKGLNAMLTVAKGKREPIHIEYLDVARPTYPQDKFDQALPAMVKAIAEKKMSIEQVVAKCQQTGDLTPEQLAALEQALPVNADDEEDV